MLILWSFPHFLPSFSLWLTTSSISDRYTIFALIWHKAHMEPLIVPDFFYVCVLDWWDKCKLFNSMRLRETISTISVISRGFFLHRIMLSSFYFLIVFLFFYFLMEYCQSSLLSILMSGVAFLYEARTQITNNNRE